MPIIERLIETKGMGPTDIVVSRVTRVHRTYVKPGKVKPSDIVVTYDEQKADGRTIAPITKKELRDPRVREDLGLAPLKVEEDDDAPAARRTREQDEDEDEGDDDGDEDDDDLDEDEADATPTPLEQFVTAPWDQAVSMIQKAAEAQNVDVLAEFVGAEMRRSKPRPSVAKAFVEAGLGEPADFVKK